MTIALKLGIKVRLQQDNGWGQPGCIMARAGDKFRVFWPDENVFTEELPANLVPYSACQPHNIAA